MQSLFSHVVVLNSVISQFSKLEIHFQAIINLVT